MGKIRGLLIPGRRGACIAQRRPDDGEQVPLPTLVAERPKDAAKDLPILVDHVEVVRLPG